jgi:hypothetical protein
MPTIYTFNKKSAPGVYYEGAAASHFMNQPNDGARIAIQGIGNGPMTTDVSATINSSPLAVPVGAATLATPESAITVTFSVPSATVNICEVNASFNSYYPVYSGVPVTLNVADCAYLWAKPLLATTATLNFFYTLV